MSETKRDLTGLVKWTDPPKGFRKTVFAGVEITDKGRALLSTRRDT